MGDIQLLAPFFDPPGLSMPQLKKHSDSTHIAWKWKFMECFGFENAKMKSVWSLKLRLSLESQVVTAQDCKNSRSIWTETGTGQQKEMKHQEQWPNDYSKKLQTWQVKVSIGWRFVQSTTKKDN